MKNKIRKILIANRGEIAIRVMKTCNTMGIRTVAVFSDADAQAPYLRYADETYHIGKSPARESYLNQAKIIEVARESGADAIHPGYGFLSENPTFVDAVHKAGLIFIGPSGDAIRHLGDKTSAKAVAQKIGVPVVPGTVKALENAGEALEIAKSIGFPVLLKAAAGGGGKGMRVVRDAKDLPAALQMAKSEAASSFSDDRVYIEKYILNPRHVEVQIIADSHGNVVHLGERECSIQRRHQKIIEESPSPAITGETRAGLTASAVKLAAHVGYTNAGTVEFILDESGRYYFMEVNTRLQVEHPVTELRTGIDLVREQIRVAAGEKLSVSQKDIRFDGHALECRIYAEDSANNFMPFIGTIGHIAHPSGRGIRLDTGIDAGSAISAYYDPMISKVIAHARTRDEALATMVTALESYEIYGVKTNIDLLLWILADPDFASGRFDTHFLDRKYRPGLFDGTPQAVRILSGLVAGYLHLKAEDRFNSAANQNDRQWIIHRSAIVR
jgi:acetyl-CoA carboxylase biotin carboxylase subunit